MKKVFHIIALSLLITPLINTSSQAQSVNSGWKLSLGGGYMNYYGDLSPYRIQKWKDWKQAFKFFQYNDHYIPEASFGISLEKGLTPGIGLMIQANKGAIEMSDRYRKPGGSYDLDAPHWDRALNFKTDIYDAGLALTFHADNGKLLHKNAFFSPYLFLGGGVTYFKVKGDLYDENGNPYDYSDPNVQPDGKYETNLRDLKTERNKKYNNVTPYADLGIGVKFRLSKGVSLIVQTDINYSFSDYLDDVSGTYKNNYGSPEEAYAARPGTNVSTDNKRGYDDGVNDFYIFNKAAIQFNLGGGKSRFKAPVVYQPTKNRSLLLREKEQQEQKIKEKNQVVDTTTSSKHIDSLKKADQASSKDTTNQSTEKEKQKGEVHQIRLMLRRSRFDHIDQNYIIKENKLKYKIADQKENIKALREKAPLSKQDSLQLLKDESKLKDLYYELKAVKEARQQLRQRFSNTPIVTEYADSTKIMIYRNQQTTSAEDTLYELNNENEEPIKEVTDTVQSTSENKNIDSTKEVSQEQLTKEKLSSEEKDSLKKVYLRKIDSLKNINDSLRQQSSKTADSIRNNRISRTASSDIGSDRDSIQTAYDSLLAKYKEDSIRTDSQRVQIEKRLNANKSQLKKDSLNRSRLQSRIDSILKQNNRDSLQRKKLHGKIDSLLTLYKKDSAHSKDQSLLLKGKQADNRKRLRKDSLQRLQLQRKVDSLQELQNENLRKVNSEDTAKRNFFQRVFKSRKKTTSQNAAHRDTIRRLQRQLSKENAAIRKLNDNIEDLRKQNQNYDDQLSDLKGDRGLQASYLRAAIDEMNRRGMAYNNAPSLSAPIVVPTGNRAESNNNDEQLEDISRKLDSVQQIKEQLEGRQPDTTRNLSTSEVERIRHQLDSLKKREAQEQKEAREKNMNNLENHVDSLNRSIHQMKGEAASKAAEEEMNNRVNNFPVVSTYFATGSSTLDEKGVSSLRPVAAFVKKYDGVFIVLKGFTDATGSAHANKIVAQRRVDAVKQLLVSRYNIDASKIKIEPVTSSTTGRGSNPLDRRVDVKLERK